MEKFRDWINYNRIVHGSVVPPAVQLALLALFPALFAVLFFNSLTFRIVATTLAAVGMPLVMWMGRKGK